jgi:poly(glycerol-phosphate) alpha-glucosyltransferase
MSILEALASRLPTLITHQCNFPEVAQADAGVLADPTAQSVEDGLRRLLRMSDEERAAMGRRGRTLIEQHYTWQAVAAKMIAVDNWLLGRADRPDFVHI